MCPTIKHNRQPLAKEWHGQAGEEIMPQLTANELACLINEVLSEIDEISLNNAAWEFIESWDKHTDQVMSGNTFNNIKPMLRAAIKKYMTGTPNNQGKSVAEGDPTSGVNDVE